MTSRILTVAAAAALSLGISFGASATYNSNYGDWDVNSDAGAYAPVVLGESIDLDACGSTFFNYYNQSQSYSLCDLTDLNDFTLTWKAKLSGQNGYTVLAYYSGGNVANGFNVSVSTGAGTFFSAAGTYYIGLYLTVANYSYTLLPNNSWAYSSYYGNRDLDWSNSFAITEPQSVPEPAAALLLLPAFVLVARRERRRRLKQGN